MAGVMDGQQTVLARYRYVFIVTYARSGSTLLQSMMNSCPGVQIRGENSNTLFGLYRAAAAVEATRVYGRHPKTKEPDEPWHGSGSVRPLAFEAGLLNNFVRNVLAPDPGITVTGFKEIRYNHLFVPQNLFAPYMDFMLSKFPDARIVFNSRRAADVAKSAFLAKQDPTQIHAWVTQSDRNFKAYAAASPERSMHLQYEDYIADHSHIHRMLDFLGLTWDADQVERVFAKPLTHAKEGSAGR